MTVSPAIQIPIGFGQSITIYPCAPSIPVIFEGLEAASAKLFLSLISPSWKTDVKWLTGGTWLHDIREVMLDAELIDPVLIDATGTRALFLVADFVDTFAWWMFVAGLTVEFLMDWTTQVWQMSGCLPDPKRYWLESKNCNAVFRADGQWREAMSFTNCRTSDGITTNFGSPFSVFEGTSFSLVWTCVWGDVSGNVQPAVQRVIRGSDDMVLDTGGYEGSYWSQINGNIDNLRNSQVVTGGDTIHCEAMPANATMLLDYWANSGYLMFEVLTF